MTLHAGMNTPMQREAELRLLEGQAKAIDSLIKSAEATKKEISLALNDIISSLIKQEDTPCSSDMHLYSAIQRLRGLVPDWNAWDKEED